MKPQLACDVDFYKVKFPLIGLAKVDGVRGINLEGTLTGRSLKEFKNKFVTARYSGADLQGFDGELCLGSDTDPRLCSNTTGFVNRKVAREGKPTESEELIWWIFDDISPSWSTVGYHQRLLHAEQRVQDLRAKGNTSVNVIPWKWIHNREELEAFDAECLDAGYEGSIFRDPEGLHKDGRATARTCAYLRLKRFIDFEGTIVGVEEAMENQNEAKTNELGRTERSTHQENMVPKGMIGTIKMEALQDVMHGDTVVVKKGQLLDIGPGSMPHLQRVHYWENQAEFIGQIGKAKFFPHGIKDKIRFPTFLSLRAEEDMSN